MTRLVAMLAIGMLLVASGRGQRACAAPLSPLHVRALGHIAAMSAAGAGRDMPVGYAPDLPGGLSESEPSLRAVSDDDPTSAIRRILDAAQGAPVVWGPSVDPTTPGGEAQSVESPSDEAASTRSAEPSDRPAGTDPLERLRRMARSADAYTRVQAVRELRNASTPQSVALAASMLGDVHPLVWEESCGVLASAPRESVSEALLTLLPEAAPPLRSGIVSALPSLRGAIEGPVLGVLMDERADESRRCVAAFLLSRMGSIEALDELAALAKGSQGALPRACAESMSALAQPVSLHDFVALLGHADAMVRRYALHGLDRIGGPAVAETLHAALSAGREPDPQIRREMVAVLGVHGNDDSVALLMALMQRDPMLQHEAIRALSILTGVNMGRSPRQWEQWYADLRRERARIAAERAAAERDALPPASADAAPLEGVPAVPLGFVPGTASEEAAEPEGSAKGSSSQSASGTHPGSPGLTSR